MKVEPAKIDGSGAEAPDEGCFRTADWFRYPAGVNKNGTVAIIGAGVVGCATARELARRGRRVVVFERAEKLSRGVGSLGQLALHCRTFGTDNPPARFFLQGFLHSAREFAGLARDRGFGWHPCGLVQLPQPREWQRKPDPAALAELYPDEVLQWLSREQLWELTGLPIAGDGWYSPAAGWLVPMELRRCWLDHPGISLHTGVDVDSIKRADTGWRLTANGESVQREAFAAVVVACGADATRFAALRELPLLNVPGEVVFVPETPASAGIRHIIRGDRGIFPAVNGRHCISASFAKEEVGASVGIRDVRAASLALAGKAFAPELTFAGEAASTARALRCQAVDFLPVLGAAPDVAQCRDRFAALARNARARLRQPPAHLPGLYVNLAHGSHGLCSAPLAAAYLASVMHGEAPPLPRATATALDPMRFLIRDLRRQRKV